MAGIGAALSVEGQTLKSMKVLPNTPASHAGLIPGLNFRVFIASPVKRIRACLILGGSTLSPTLFLGSFVVQLRFPGASRMQEVESRRRVTLRAAPCQTNDLPLDQAAFGEMAQLNYVAHEFVYRPSRINWVSGIVSLAGAEFTSEVTGTYTNVPGAFSPYTNLITGSRQFFRLKY